MHASGASHTLVDVRQVTPPFPAVWVQPVEGAQASTVQGLLSLQFGAPPPTHVPALQASFVVQALPSWHAVPESVVHTPEALHA